MNLTEDLIQSPWSSESDKSELLCLLHQVWRGVQACNSSLIMYSHHNPKSKPDYASCIEDWDTWRMNLKEDILLSYDEKDDAHSVITYSQ